MLLRRVLLKHVLKKTHCVAKTRLTKARVEKNTVALLEKNARVAKTHIVCIC